MIRRVVGAAAQAAALALLAAPRAAAQSEGNVLAVIPASTRAVALGGAGVALVGDAAAIFANPAGIATVRRVALEASYERYLGGTALSVAAMAIRFGRFNWGLGAHALDYGAEPEIIPDATTGGRRGTPTGAVFNAVDVLGASSLVYRHGLLAFGATAKYARQSIAGTVADAWAGDVGMAVAVFDLMALGVAVRNLGGAVGPDARLPHGAAVGLTLNYTDPQGTFRLLTTGEVQWGEGTTWIIGAEGGIVVGGLAGAGLVGRVGFAQRPPGVIGSPLSFGAGVVIGRLQLDYAYRGFASLGTTHRVGLRWTP